MIEVTFDDKETRRFMAAVLAKTKEIKGASDRYVALLSATVFRDIMEHFEREEGPDGKWQKWSDSYKKYLAKINRSGNKILQFDGRLRQNFTPQKVKKSSQGILWYNNAQVKGFPYAAAHNEGGGKLPKRTFMWASEQAVEKMAEQTLSFIVEEKV